MDPKLKIVLAVAAGALGGMLLLSAAFAIPAVIHLVAAPAFSQADEGFGPGMMDRQGGPRGGMMDGRDGGQRGPGGGMMGPGGGMMGPRGGGSYEGGTGVCPNGNDPSTCPNSSDATGTSL